MARSAPAFSSFTAGEISPRMEGRVTLDTYREGLADMTNLLVMPQGGVTRRPGTEFLGEIKDSSKAARLIPFQFKTSDTYILEFGDQVMRVYRNGAQVLDASVKTITGITQASPGVITSNSHGLSNGDEIYIDAIVGMTELNGRNYRVAGATTNTFTLVDLFGNAINTTGLRPTPPAARPPRSTTSLRLTLWLICRRCAMCSRLTRCIWCIRRMMCAS
jgi:hypothetical protein